MYHCVLEKTTQFSRREDKNWHGHVTISYDVTILFSSPHLLTVKMILPDNYFALGDTEAVHVNVIHFICYLQAYEKQRKEVILLFGL